LSSIDYRGLNKITTKTIDRSEADYPRYLLDNIVGILDPDSLVWFLPHFESDPPDNAQVQDYGPRGLHFSKHTTSDVDPIIRGSVLPYRFNGTNEGIDSADNDLFSMGADGTAPNEPAFSIGGMYKLNANASQTFLSRFDVTVAAEETEWWLFTGGAGTLSMRIYDDVGTVAIGRTFTTALSINEWLFIVATYDASRVNSGITLYVNGVAVDDANNSAGVYTAMHNEAVDTVVGFMTGGGGASDNFLNGFSWGEFQTAKELSAVEAVQLTDLYRRLLGL